jgi:hypothetical protein
MLQDQIGQLKSVSFADAHREDEYASQNEEGDQQGDHRSFRGGFSWSWNAEASHLQPIRLLDLGWSAHLLSRGFDGPQETALQKFLPGFGTF